ncbi:type IX secretion/gliding motility protein PorT/SprT [Daejeonella oryzae]|uniref:type IX secretion/gliding motility protein PorT/SprT n=1 Tax=Daejeonella oryzae TaxID=1122943 RepID=UPI00040AE870|nr:outer membrane beta-barrel protein [Daejeonella oryzae]
MIIRFYLTILISIISGVTVFGQNSWGGGVDDDPFHFGFTFQYISSEYKIVKKPDWRAPFIDPEDGSQVKPDLYSISSPTSPGFGLGFVSNYRMGKNADLRFTPALIFSDRFIDYRYEDPEEFKQQRIQSTLVDFPLGIKIKSDRRKNFRAYWIGGAKYSIDIVSKKKTNDEDNILSEKFVKNTRNILWYETGIGFDLYFEFFKLSPEIKLSNSFKSVLRPEEHPYSAPLDKLFLRNFQFSLYFE